MAGDIVKYMDENCIVTVVPSGTEGHLVCLRTGMTYEGNAEPVFRIIGKLELENE